MWRYNGKGGMGEVYRAQDTKLGREVALKILPAELSADPVRLQRFEREARVVAALNHPHIVPLYSVEESEGVPFLTMELVEGDNLEPALTQGKRPLTEVLAEGVAVGEALAIAHAKGAVHRDPKLAKIMVDCTKTTTRCVFTARAGFFWRGHSIQPVIYPLFIRPSCINLAKRLAHATIPPGVLGPTTLPARNTNEAQPDICSGPDPGPGAACRLWGQKG